MRTRPLEPLAAFGAAYGAAMVAAPGGAGLMLAAALSAGAAVYGAAERGFLARLTRRAAGR